MIQDFKGKTAVLTGAGSGFGLECARIGARLGMNLVLVDVQADALERAELYAPRDQSFGAWHGGKGPMLAAYGLADTAALTSTEFMELKQGLLAQLQERDNSLGARAKRFWLAIGQQDNRFDLTQRIIVALQQLELDQFVQFLHQLLRPDYDAIFLATAAPGPHSHLQQKTAAALRQQLLQMQIGFDSSYKVL